MLFAGRARYAVLGRCAACARHVRALELAAGIRPSGGARLDAAENDSEPARSYGRLEGAGVKHRSLAS